MDCRIVIDKTDSTNRFLAVTNIFSFPSLSSGTTNGFYEVADDGSIHFVQNNEQTKDVTSTTTTTTETPTTDSPTTSEPSLSDDESVKDYADGEDEFDDTLWEFVPHRVEVHDPLRDSQEFPLVDTNEIEDEPRNVSHLMGSQYSSR